MGEIVSEVKTKDVHARLIKYGPDEWSYGAVFPSWKKQMHFLIVELPYNKAIGPELTIKNLVEKLNGLRSKAALDKINIAAYNIEIYRGKVKITIYSDKPLTRKYLGFFDIGKIISDIGNFFGGLTQGIKEGVQNFFTPDIVLRDPNVGIGLGELVLGGMVILGGFLIVDTIMRKEAAVAAGVPIRPYYAEAVAAPVEYARVWAPVAKEVVSYPGKVVEATGKVAETAGKLAPLVV
jgi:hypothetical protein